MQAEWTADWGGLTNWLAKTLAGDDPDLGDISVPSVIEISNAPGGSLHGMSPVQVNLMGNNSTTDVESLVFEKVEQILNRYPERHAIALRFAPRAANPEGGLGPSGEAYTFRLTRIRRGEMVSTTKTEEKLPEQARISPSLVQHAPNAAFDRDTALSGVVLLLETMVHSANLAATREGHTADRLATFLTTSSQSHSEELRAARGDMIQMLTLSSERQQGLVREIATATATLTAERATAAAAERSWENDRARLEERVTMLEEELESTRDELTTASQEAATTARSGDGYKRRMITAERALAEVTKRYGLLVKERAKLKKAAESSGDGLGGMLAMFQEFMAQKNGEVPSEVGAPASKKPEPEPEPEPDADEDLLDQPPVIGLIRPIGSPRRGVRKVKKPTRVSTPVPRKVPAAPTRPAPAAPVAPGGFDLSALMNATPDQIAMAIQLLPAKTRQGALTKIATTNPDLAASVRSDIAEALGEDEEDEDDLDDLGDIFDTGDAEDEEEVEDGEEVEETDVEEDGEEE